MRCIETLWSPTRSFLGRGLAPVVTLQVPTSLQASASGWKAGSTSLSAVSISIGARPAGRANEGASRRVVPHLRHMSTAASPLDSLNGASTGTVRHLNLLHFNDVYNVESRDQEPVGGAARFVTRCRELQKVCAAALISRIPDVRTRAASASCLRNRRRQHRQQRLHPTCRSTMRSSSFREIASAHPSCRTSPRESRCRWCSTRAMCKQLSSATTT